MCNEAAMTMRASVQALPQNMPGVPRSLRDRCSIIDGLSYPIFYLPCHTASTFAGIAIGGSRKSSGAGPGCCTAPAPNRGWSAPSTVRPGRLCSTCRLARFLGETQLALITQRTATNTTNNGPPVTIEQLFALKLCKRRTFGDRFALARGAGERRHGGFIDRG